MVAQCLSVEEAKCAREEMLEEHDLLIPKDLNIEEEARIGGKEVWRTGLTGEMEIYMPALAREKQDTEARSNT